STCVTVIFDIPQTNDLRLRCGPMDVRFQAPYNEKNQLFGRKHARAARTEIYHQSAKHRLPHEGESATKRAEDHGSLGADENLRDHPPSPQRRDRVCAEQRPTLRQWAHPLGYGDEQMSKGFYRQI